MTNRELQSIYFGAYSFRETTDGYLQAFQYSDEQMAYFRSAFDFWYDRCMASTAKTLEFTTDARTVSFDYKIIWEGSQDSFELAVDGLISDIRYVKDLPKAGRLEWALPDGTKDIVVYLPADATVLIRGASGTGKELLAHAIVELSARKDKKRAHERRHRGIRRKYDVFCIARYMVQRHHDGRVREKDSERTVPEQFQRRYLKRFPGEDHPVHQKREQRSGKKAGKFDLRAAVGIAHEIIEIGLHNLQKQRQKPEAEQLPGRDLRLQKTVSQKITEVKIRKPSEAGYMPDLPDQRGKPKPQDHRKKPHQDDLKRSDYKSDIPVF